MKLNIVRGGSLGPPARVYHGYLYPTHINAGGEHLLRAPGSSPAPTPGPTLSCEEITPTKHSESLTGTQIIQQIDRTFTTSTMMMLTD